MRLGDAHESAASFETLRAAVMTVAQKGIKLQRFKGLGEMNAEQLGETTMAPATRTLAQVTLEDAFAADRIFSMLMGDQVEPRRAFIEDNAGRREPRRVTSWPALADRERSRSTIVSVLAPPQRETRCVALLLQRL